MKIRAVKVIRSATISGHHIHKPGELGEILSTSTDITGRTIHVVRWEDGERCVALPADVEAVEATVAIAPAATDLSAQPSEAASSSRSLVRHTEHADLSGQEPVGTLPHFRFDFQPSWAAGLWWEMGGEG